MPSPLRPYLEAERPQPVLLPQAERRQLRRRKEAALTDIAARYRKRGLLWAYEIGVEIVDVQDQRLEDPDLDLGPIDFRRFGVGRSQGYDHAQMARYVRRDWVMAAPDSNLTTTFHEIARGEPPLKEWIRQELCRFACRTRCTTDRMKQVRRGLEESLDGLAPEAPAPTPEWLGALIEELASRPEDPRALLARLHKKFRPFLRKLHRAGVLDAGQDLLLDLMKEVAGQERRQAPRDAEETSAAETGAAGAAAPSPEIGPPALPDPAPDPERVYLCQNDLPVPYPANDYGVSPAERHAACLVIVLSAIATACRTIIPCRNLVYPISPRRALCAYDRLNLFESRMLALVPLLAGAVARHQQRQPPGAPAPLPLSTDPEDGHRLPMAWVSYEAADPLDEPDPSNLDLWFCHLFGLLDCGGGLLDQFLERYRTDLMADDLLFQLDRAIDLCHLPLLEVALYLRRPAEEARELAQKEQERLALLRPVLEAAQERTRVLGEEGPVPLYTVFARTDDGSPLAITQNTPQLVLAQGRQGGGKSHALKLMWEGCAHPHPGLGKSDGPRLCVRIGSDWQQGTGGDEVRGGFYPNRDPAQWDLLRTDYLVERTNAAVRRAHLLCYPESVEPFKRRYADLVERGLVIEPLALDPSEVGLFGYGVYLSAGAEGPRPAHRALVESLIGWLGADATPQKLAAELCRHRVDSRVKDSLLLQLKRLERLIVPGHYLIDKLDRNWPMVVHLESRYEGPDQVVPMEVTILNALGRPLRSGQDPFRWFFLEELNPHLRSTAMGEYLKEAGTQLRHRPNSYFVCGQRASDWPVGFAALPTILMQFNTPSVAEFKKSQEQFGLLSGVRYPEVRELPDGVALIGAVRATDRWLVERVRRATLRPSLLWTGGETTAAVGR